MCAVQTNWEEARCFLRLQGISRGFGRGFGPPVGQGDSLCSNATAHSFELRAAHRVHGGLGIAAYDAREGTRGGLGSEHAVLLVCHHRTKYE
jgi:hypothetical protein